MNLIKSDLRSSLSDVRLDSLMHISLNGRESIDNILDDLISLWESRKQRVFE
jgi:hypothetical protein